MPPHDPLGYPVRRSTLHYHGDTVRGLFVVAALLLIVAETTGASLPYGTPEIVAFAIVLAVAAGITNPAQSWIHIVNTAISIFGAVVFGLYAIEQYQATQDFYSLNYVYGEALALLFLVTIYFATKTVRGFFLRANLS